MEQLHARTCSICRRESDAIRRRLRFRRWEEALATLKPSAEVQHLCGACHARDRRTTLLYIRVLAAFLLISSLVTIWAILVL